MSEQPGPPSVEGPRFSLGNLYATPGALDACERARVEPATHFARHAAGDWGDIDPEDRGLNEQALVEGSRIFSVYTQPTDGALWVITEQTEPQPRRLCPMSIDSACPESATPGVVSLWATGIPSPFCVLI